MQCRQCFAGIGMTSIEPRIPTNLPTTRTPSTEATPLAAPNTPPYCCSNIHSNVTCERACNTPVHPSSRSCRQAGSTGCPMATETHVYSYTLQVQHLLVCLGFLLQLLRGRSLTGNVQKAAPSGADASLCMQRGVTSWSCLGISRPPLHPPTTLMRPSTANDTRAAELLKRTIREEEAVAT